MANSPPDRLTLGQEVERQAHISAATFIKPNGPVEEEFHEKAFNFIIGALGNFSKTDINLEAAINRQCRNFLRSLEGMRLAQKLDREGVLRLLRGVRGRVRKVYSTADDIWKELKSG